MGLQEVLQPRLPDPVTLIAEQLVMALILAAVSAAGLVVLLVQAYAVLVARHRRSRAAAAALADLDDDLNDAAGAGSRARDH